MWVNPGACAVCGWQIVYDDPRAEACRCTLERRRATTSDVKLRAFVREWDALGEAGRRLDQERQAQGEPPLGALIILAADS